MDKKNLNEVPQEEIEKPVYIDYKDLDEIKENERRGRVEELIKVLNEDNMEKWLPQFNAIMDLRRLLKYCRQEFLKVFHEIFQIIPKQINSLRSGCSKLSLMLLNELFTTSNNSNEVPNEWIEALLPNIIMKTNFLQKFIKDEALSALANISKTMFSYVVLDILVQNVGNKNVTHSEAAFDSLTKLIENWNINDLMKVNDLPNIFSKIADVNKLKKEPYNKRSIKIISLLYEKLGKNNFESLLSKAGEETRSFIDNILKQSIANEKKVSLKESGVLREQIKKDKTKDGDVNYEDKFDEVKK